MTHVYLAEDLVRDPPRLVNRQIRLPSSPGLGVDVDEEIVRRFTIS